MSGLGAGAAATLMVTAKGEEAAVLKAQSFLSLERVPARGNLSVGARLTRLVGASTNDRFRTAANARRLSPEAVMARYAHERETYSKESTPVFVKGVIAQIEDLKSRAFVNVRATINGAEPADLSGLFERVMREARKIPYEASVLKDAAFVADELYAFLQWFRETYMGVVESLRVARYSRTAALSRAVPVVSTRPPGEKTLAERFVELGKPLGSMRRERTHRNRRTRNRRATRRHRRN